MSDTVAKPRGRGRPKGTPASAKQKAAAAENSKRAAVAKRERKQARKKAEQAGELEKPRWKQLEDGDISVKDLTMDELIKGEVANNDGTWEGKRHRFDSRMLGRIETERRRRIRRDFDKLAPDALDAFEDMINDIDNPAQRLAASKLVLEHQIGKVPDVVHINHETEWDRLQQAGFRILRGDQAVLGDGEEDDSHVEED